MSRNTKRKLAIVAGISECLIYAEAKYCAFEIHGDPKYYVCPRTEYCCNFGCCVSPGFQIYHLWYYWLLVIIMFLVCSGGGWWYRYWLQGRYRAAASAIPTRGTGSSRSHGALRGQACPAQQASITYNSARNTVLLHRMWKAGPHRGAGSSPAYPGPPLGAAASSTHFQNTSVVLNDVNCPYYQLYGPPPSYETVIAQTRGKLSSPLSPERSRNLDVTAATGSSTLTAQDVVARCYNHSPYNGHHPSQNGTIVEIQDPSTLSRYEPTGNIVDNVHHCDSPEPSVAFTPYVTPYTSNATGATPIHSATRQDSHLPLDYHGGPMTQLDYRGDPAAIVPDTFRIYHGNNFERLPSYHGDVLSSDAKFRRHNGSSMTGCAGRDNRGSSFGLTGDGHSSVPDLKTEADATEFPDPQARASQDDGRERYARNHGGSLKFSRIRDEPRSGIVGFGGFRRGQTFLEIAAGSATRSAAGDASNEDSNVPRDPKVTCGLPLDADEPTSARDGRNRDDFRDSGVQGSFSRSTRNGLLNGDARRASLRRYGVAQHHHHQQQQQQTNPSDNVILEPLSSATSFEAEGAAAPVEGPGACRDEGPSWRNRRHEHDEKRRRRVPSPGARGTINEGGASGADNNHESKRNKLDRSKSLD